ncbi:hypothetical protein D3C87_1964590 [compost metagenome]
MFDGLDVTAHFFHVLANVFEVCLQLSDARFHINFSLGFFAACEICLMIGPFFSDRYDRHHWQPDVMVLHGTSLCLSC